MTFSDVLEFQTFKQYLIDNFNSYFAKSYANKLKPYKNLENILLEQKYFKEIFFLLDLGFQLNTPEDSNYLIFYEKIKDPYASFTPEDFITFKIFHVELNMLKKEILSNKDIKELKNITSNIYTFAEIIEYITDKIADDARVKDSASDELFDIRQKLNIIRKEITNAINRIFSRSDVDKFVQEKVIKEYNNRYILLCKTNFKQYINGIVHSTSGSGQTYYVEPASLIELNNTYQTLIKMEEEEVNKILRSILDKLKSSIFEIVKTAENYSKLSFIISCAKVYNTFKYVIPEVGDEIIFDEIYHPLILFSKKEKAVPISFDMKKGINLSIITGPNTGGKTAALKTCGLNTIIAKCGLPLFGRYAKIVNFDNVLADIGDNQSLIMNLSTFSSHLLNIKEVIERSNNNTLVLLDELGTGTEPNEGAALAMGVLERLKQKGAKVVVTTHFSEIKTYGLNRQDCEIYSVDFDYQTFEPSYRLLKSVVGKSNPIIVAKKLQFDDYAINFAEQYLLEKSNSKELLFEELNLLKAKIEREKLRLLKRERELLEKEKELNEKEAYLKEKLQEKELDLLEETYLLLNKAKRIVDKKSRQKIEEEITDEEVKKVEERLKAIKSEKSLKDKIEIGDVVFLEKYEKVAKILEIKKESVFVDLEGLKVKLDINDVIGKKVTKSENKSVKVNKDVTVGVRSEIVVIGKKVEEAIDEIDKFIDKALLSNVSKIYIVHGRGSGQLRKGVHEYLKNQAFVKSFRVAENSEGGQAITVVEL